MKHWLTCGCTWRARQFAKVVLGYSVLMGLVFGVLSRVI